MRNYILLVFLLVVFTSFSYGAETWQESADLVRGPCVEFVQRHSKPEFIKKWRKKLEDRIEQRIVDSGGSYEGHLQAIVLDWASGQEKKLKDGEMDAYIELCLYIGVFIEKGMSPPRAIRDRMMPDVAQQLVDRLKSF